MARSSLLSHKCGTLIWLLFDHWWPHLYKCSFHHLCNISQPLPSSCLLWKNLTAAPGSSLHWLLIPFWINYKFWRSPINASISTHKPPFRNLSLQSPTPLLSGVQAASSSMFLAPNFAPWKTEAPLFLTYGTASPSILGLLRAWTLVKLN